MGATDECRHGGLRRKCEACDLEEQLAAAEVRDQLRESRIDLLEYKLAASQERVAELERENASMRGLPPYKLGYVDGRYDAETAVHALSERHARMGHIENVDDALDYAAREAAGELTESGREDLLVRAENAERERDEAVARAEKAIDLLSQWSENDNDGLGPDGDLLADTAELIDATRPEPARSDAGGEETPLPNDADDGGTT